MSASKIVKFDGFTVAFGLFQEELYQEAHP